MNVGISWMTMRGLGTAAGRTALPGRAATTAAEDEDDDEGVPGTRASEPPHEGIGCVRVRLRRNFGRREGSVSARVAWGA